MAGEEIDQAEKRRVLANDRSVREQQQQASTYFQHAVTEAAEPQGRFAAINSAMVIGGTPVPKYPELPASSPWAGPDIVPPEPPLGHAIDAMRTKPHRRCRLPPNLARHLLTRPRLFSLCTSRRRARMPGLLLMLRKNTMAERTAAEAMYPHLKSQVPQPRQQSRISNPIAQEMYPSLVKPAAKSQAQITPADLKAWAEYIRKLP